MTANADNKGLPPPDRRPPARRPEQAGAARAAPPAGTQGDFTVVWSPQQKGAEAPRGPAGILLKQGRITLAQLAAAQKCQQANPHVSVLDALVEARVIDTATAHRTVAEYFNVPFLSVKADQVNRDAFALLTTDFIKRKNVLPIAFEDKKVVVGVHDPADIFLIDEIRRPIKLVVTPVADIQAVVEVLGVSPLDGMEDIIEGINEDDVEVVEAVNEEVADLEKIAGESPIIRYVNYLITKAVGDGASDIHVEPSENKLRVRYRIDGILFEQATPPPSMHAAIVSRVKIMANTDIAERRLPQDGRIRAMVHGRHVDLRVSTLPTTHGEKLVIRILDNRSILVGLENLGMWSDTLTAFRRQIEQPHGVVLVTGPTGSGKTTTLYSAMRTMDGNTLNISTVEDPVEYELSFANQVNVREHIGLTFAAALRSLLRQDPDVIMIGEIRDEETARIAVQASLTGHLVLSTLHTNDAPSSITRLINIGIEPYLIAASVNAVIAQRLVRRICPNCKTPLKDVREGTLRYMAKHKVELKTLYHGAGCEKCRKTGYSGRLGIYELLEMDDDVRDLVTSSPSLMDLRRACRQRGMRDLAIDGIQKIANGLTTVDEIIRVTETT